MTAQSPAASPLARPDRSIVGAVGVLLVVGAFFVVGGAFGAAAGVGVAVVWALLAPPVAFAAGHVALLAVLPGGATTAELVVVELPLLVVLFAPLASRERTPDRLRSGLAGAVITGVLVGATVLALDALDAAWQAAGLVALLAALCGYGLYRLELVRLDLVNA